MAESGRLLDGPAGEGLVLSSRKAAPQYGSVSSFSPEPLPEVCWYILIVELCERLAYYTLSGSQAFFLEHVGFSFAASGALNATMWTLSTLFAPFLSWIADAMLGRYWTILASILIYALGTGLAACAAWPGIENSTLYFVGVLFLVPCATAGIKCNIMNFGADQYDPSHPHHEKAQERFFSIFYFSINVGACLAFGFLTTLATNGGLGVPQKFGYSAAYGTVTACILVGTLVFVCGRYKYVVEPLQQRSALVVVFSTLLQEARASTWQAGAVLVGVVLLFAMILLSTVMALMGAAGSGTKLAAFAFFLIGTLAVIVPCLRLDAWLADDGEDADGEKASVRRLLAILPTLFTGSLAFGALTNSMAVWYQQQACQMDTRVYGIQLSGSFFTIASCFAVILATPLAVNCINPILERRLGQNLSCERKFSIGMLVAGTSVLLAAKIECMRRGSPVLTVASNCAPAGVNMSNMSGSWMIAPYFLMGVGEIYAVPSLLHFAYTKSGPGMRTLAMAAWFFVSSAGSALFALIVLSLKSHIPDNLNDGNLEYGYIVNLAIGIGAYVMFTHIIE